MSVKQMKKFEEIQQRIFAKEKAKQVAFDECVSVNPSNPLAVAQNIGEMVKLMQWILSLDDSGALDAMAYSGGDVPKKWLREVAPALTARSTARKEIQTKVRQVISAIEKQGG